MRTLDQQMAAYAFQKVSAHENASKSLRDKYGIWCKGLPGLIQQCGLAQAIAFLESKAARTTDPGHEAFQWLLQDLWQVPGLDAVPSLEVYIRQCPVSDYILATRRIQLALVFFKRFSESVLDFDPSSEEETDA